MKLQKIINRLQKLHPREIDLSLDRIKSLCKKLGNPQDELKCIQVCGTNGKGSTISFLRSILKEANIKCNIYTSPHVKCINERFIYNDEMISDDDLSNLLNEIEETKSFQIREWKEVKRKHQKSYKTVQHKLTGFFSDFPNPKGDK